MALQSSWDLTIQIAGILIYQLSLPLDYGIFLNRKSIELSKMNDFNSSFGSSSKVESQLIPNSLRGSDQEMMLRSAKHPKHHHKRSGSDETLEDS